MAFLGHTTPPPFYSNEDDNFYCGQACLRMAYEHLTGLPLSFADANIHTRYDGGPHLFAPSMLGFLAGAGLDVTHIELKQDHLHILAPHTHLTLEQRTPEITDVIAILSEGGVIITSLNYFGVVTNDNAPLTQQDAFGLYGENEKYSGHYVMLYDIDPKHRLVRLHNPGLPPHPAQELGYDALLAAMYSPARDMGNVTAIRRAA